MQDGLAQRLGGNGAGVDGRAAEDVVFLDNADGLAEFCGLNRGLLAGRSGTDHNAIKVSHLIAVKKPGFGWAGFR